MTYLLDTDICVFWLRGRSTVHDRIVSTGPDEIAISIVTLAELRYGAAVSARPQDNQRAVDNLVSALPVISIDQATARTYGEIKGQLRKQGGLLEDFDLLIAAIALTHHLTLVSNNTDHFARIVGLRLENWVQPSA